MYYVNESCILTLVLVNSMCAICVLVMVSLRTNLPILTRLELTVNSCLVRDYAEQFHLHSLLLHPAEVYAIIYTRVD